MYQLLVDQRVRADLSGLRYAFSAGAPLPERTAKAFRAAYGAPIQPLYGSTETGVISIDRTPDGADSSVGPPIPGVSVRIVDDGGRVLPPHEQGQVGVISPYAASSYDNLVSQGDSRFADGVFYPGDLGWMHEDGRIVLTGRTRRYINVAGNKVDPTEVESVLLEHPAIAEAVVVGVPDGFAGERIKAVLVTSASCTHADVLAYCAGRLADFKRPRIIDFRPEIPKSPLGKVLRKYLIDEALAG